LYQAARPRDEGKEKEHNIIGDDGTNRKQAPAHNNTQ
jgi:hypothetical protein